MAKKPAKKVADIRSRIVEVKRIKASDIASHPGNWRDHPESQAKAIAGVMREVGDVGVLLAWRSPRNKGKLTLIDGHLRKGVAPDHEYMVAITDLSDAEADYVLATHDPLASLAVADAGALDALLATVASQDGAVKAMLADLAALSGLYNAHAGSAPEDDSESDELPYKTDIKIAVGNPKLYGEVHSAVVSMLNARPEWNAKVS